MTGTPLNIYLREIGKLTILSPEEEAVLLKKAKSGDRTARERIITSHLRFVVSIAKLYSKRGVPLSDLIDEGNLGLLMALKRYDLTRGVKFISYASWWIRQHILRTIYVQAKTVRVPIQKMASTKLIHQIEEELLQKLGRLPRTDEISRVLGVSPRDVDRALEIVESDLSLDALIGEEEASLLDFIKANPEHLEDFMIKRVLSEELHEKLKELSEREREVINLYFGLNGKGPHTLEETGKLLGRTRERIRQIKEIALKKLRSRVE